MLGDLFSAKNSAELEQKVAEEVKLSAWSVTSAPCSFKRQAPPPPQSPPPSAAEASGYMGRGPHLF